MIIDMIATTDIKTNLEGPALNPAQPETGPKLSPVPKNITTN